MSMPLVAERHVNVVLRQHGREEIAEEFRTTELFRPSGHDIL